MYLLDMSREFSAVADNVTTRGILIPHASVGYDPSVHAPVLTLPGDSLHERVLAHAIWTLPDRITRVDADEAQDLSRNLINVVRALMLDPTTRANGADVRIARRLAMENFIEKRLSNNGLGVDLLCRTFGVSRAALYRHFPEAGGVATYIRGRRLTAAHRELKRSELTRGRIRAVSERWGFPDPGHFHRLFKREFKVSPSDATDQFLGSQPPVVTPSKLLGDWPHR